MNVKVFAAIDIGSFETAIKIYEISAKNGMKEIDHIRHRLSLGYDSYNTGRISYRKIDELCHVLNKFRDIMKTYGASDYKVYGTSALRETDNTVIIQDQIFNRTGFKVEVLSNSEQRLLDYKSVASMGSKFNKIIESGSAIVDIGGASAQMSLFDNDSLVSTQSFGIGVLTMYDRITSMKQGPERSQEILEQLIYNELSIFKKLYIKEREIGTLIVVDDYISGIIKSGIIPGSKDGIISTENFLAFFNECISTSNEILSEKLDITEEMTYLMKISSSILKVIIENNAVKRIWAPGVALCDGIAYEYAESKKLKMIAHDFEKDIIDAAINISKRYIGSKKRSLALSNIALTIYDAMASIHGLSKRDRFLLRLAVILHECGKFINTSNVGECSYSIIMNTEMIGLSHREREIVASVVKYYYEPFLYYKELDDNRLDEDTYLRIAKLTAILKVAGNLDRGSKQKVRDISAKLSDDKLIIYVSEEDDLVFIKEAFDKNAAFFGEVYSIEPVISFAKAK